MSGLSQPGVSVSPNQIQHIDESEQTPVEVSKIFKDALEFFIGNLSQPEKKYFSEHEDAQSVIVAIKAITEKHPVHRSRLTAACRKFQHLVSRLQPYFDVVEVFVQVKPEYMALIWGSLKMIFKLSSNYISFLDKMADMFSNIATQLPAYEEFVTILQKRAAYRGENHTSAYALFINKKPSLKIKLSLASRLVWQPFDVQYDALMSRIKQHNSLLDLELRLASTKEAIAQFTRYEECFTINRALESKHKERDEEGERTQLLNQVEELKKWINPSQWTERLEEAREKRTPNTGGWILENQIYRAWKKFDQEPSGPQGSRILTIRGKVGYGKTILCSIIIDDLGSYAIDAECAATHAGHSVVFYFFDKRHGYANTPTDAIRAMLAQLLHLRRFDKITVDAASIIFKKDKTGQSTATKAEVLAVLEMLLGHLKFTYLVFDGLDECSDPQELLRTLGMLAEQSKTSAFLLIGRPSVQLPARFSKGCVRIDLDPNHLQHSNDMEMTLRPLLQELSDECLFSDELDVNQTVDMVTEKANGIFLWAKLLLDYLKLSSLTVQDREDIINDLYRLPDLDSLYRVILANLESRFPGASLNSVSRLFQLVAYARRPLKLAELHHAMSLPFDRQQTRRDLIPNIKESLGPLSGSLIELRGDGNTQFIHISIKEYFVEMSSTHGQSATSSRLFTGEGLANRNIAASCLAYIIHTVPSEPLSGSSHIIPSAQLIKGKYPFLEYSLKGWGNHFVKGFQQPQGRAESTAGGDVTWTQLSRLLNTFLTCEKVTTVWIEASWLYEMPPAVPQLPDLDSMRYLLAGHPEALKLIHEACKSLEELSRDLDALHKSWSHILTREPNEIWEPSIPAFTKSRFWVSTNKARVIKFSPSQSVLGDSIVVCSQLSQDGIRMGVVKLIPTKQWINDNKPEHIGQNHGECSDGSDDNWTARYEIWSLILNSLTTAIEITLPDKDMQPFVKNAECFPHKTTEATVSLPLSISDDLHVIIILNTIISVRTDEPSNSGQATKTAFDHQVLNIHGYVDIVDPTRHNFKKLYYLKFDPSNEYLIIMHEPAFEAIDNPFVPSGGKYRYRIPWILQIFRDENHNSGQTAVPLYTHFKTLRFGAVPEIALFAPLRGFAFHPSAPVLAFAQILNGVPGTYIWDLEEAFDDAFLVHNLPMMDPVFSADGNFLHGTNVSSDFYIGSISDLDIDYISSLRLNETRQPLIVRLPAYIRPEHASSFEGEETQCLQETTEQIQSLETFRAAVLEIAAQPQPPVQRANTLAFDKDAGGVAHISRLWELKRDGAVVLTTLGLDGQLRNETLSRLPDETRQYYDISLVHGLNPTHGMRDTMRIVLNRTSRRFYLYSDLNKAPPATVERERDSILSYVITVNLEVAFGGQLFKPALAEPPRKENSDRGSYDIRIATYKPSTWSY
ncbi:hypothetical protein F4820DRAFT_468079 [Hypoxylon rubiginosum]|uniref:Uncharacterized protein n=1 Tax=Hypoxylon rubiginosum TaxID=110542 RepID=A0ACB9Z6E6_9PEZI|nr:hypothetical protein F4820DRAFT_468079 [Hypoxylon rubiginosum]